MSSWIAGELLLTFTKAICVCVRERSGRMDKDLSTIFKRERKVLFQVHSTSSAKERQLEETGEQSHRRLEKRTKVVWKHGRAEELGNFSGAAGLRDHISLNVRQIARAVCFSPASHPLLQNNRTL